MNQMNIIICSEHESDAAELRQKILSSDNSDQKLTALDSPKAQLTPPSCSENSQIITDIKNHNFFNGSIKLNVLVACNPNQLSKLFFSTPLIKNIPVFIIDSVRGLTLCHKNLLFLTSLFGIKEVIFAVNYSDDSSKEFNQSTLDALISSLCFRNTKVIPISLKTADNIHSKTPEMHRYKKIDSTLLESFISAYSVESLPYMPVRMYSPPTENSKKDTHLSRISICTGTPRVGDKIAIPRNGQTATIKGITSVLNKDNIDEAKRGDFVNIILDQPVTTNPGELITPASERANFADQFVAKLIWVDEESLLPGRSYSLSLGKQYTKAQVTELKYKIDTETQTKVPAKSLQSGEVAVCNFALSQNMAFDPFLENPITGSFTIIDPLNNSTKGFGLIDFALRRANNIHWQKMDIHKDLRASMKNQKAYILWFTGLSGSGKSSIANLVEKKLFSLNKHTYILDGDNVRHGLNKDLGFSEADRVENIRRIGETARLFVDAGLIVIASFISPFKSERLLARNLVKEGEFIEVFIDTPLSICEQRDVKGLYKKARTGELPNFTGVSSPYERPEKPEIIINGEKTNSEEAADIIMHQLKNMLLL